MAKYAIDSQSGEWLHLPIEGGILVQPRWLMDCVWYAWRTWAAYSKPANMMTPNDHEWMGNVVQPPRPGEETREWLIKS